MDGKKLISVKNRNNGSTGYVLPDTKLNRTWAPEETKQIPFEELQQVQWIPGGEYILNNLLIIQDKDALEALNMHVEPEYNYTETEIRKLFNFETSLDQFEDFLNFAPEGCIELAKQIAVQEEVPDSRKREMLSKKTGFNIDSAIQVNRIMNKENDGEVKDTAPKRKATPVATESSTPARKATPPTYKVVIKN